MLPPDASSRRVGNQCADKYLALEECRERSSLYLAFIFFFTCPTLYYAILR